MAAPDFRITYRDSEGNYYAVGALFRHEFNDGKYVLNPKFEEETGEGAYGPTMTIEDALARVRDKDGFLNFYPFTPKVRDDGY